MNDYCEDLIKLLDDAALSKAFKSEKKNYGRAD